MRVNRAKRILREGGTVIGTMVTQFRSMCLPQLFSSAGLDFITVDTEHAPHSMETIMDINRASHGVDLTVLVRATDIEYHLIARCLDMGAEGIVVPQVETREMAERVVNYVKFPPVGQRRWGTGSVHTHYEPVTVAGTIENQNANSMIVFQIETVRAVENIDDLLAAPGVDVAMVGPYDLSVSLGKPGEFRDTELVRLTEKVFESCHRHGVAPGMFHSDMSLLKEWQARGARYLVYANDERLLLSAAANAARAIRGEVES